MSGILAPWPVFQAFANNGQFLAGGFLYSYQAGTTIPQPTYTDSTLATPNTNPIQLDARGSAVVFLNPAFSYKLNITDSAGNPIAGWPVDNVNTAAAVGVTSSLIPSINNVYTLGNSTSSWANLYLGPNSLPAYNTASGIIGATQQTPAETLAGVLPTNFSYPPGDVRRYGADPTGTNDSTAAIVAANSQAQQVLGSRVWFVRGTYLYTPTVTLQIGGGNDFGAPWWGEDARNTQIAVNTGAFVLPCFQITANGEVRDLFFQQVGTQFTGTCLQITAPVNTNFTGHCRLTRVIVTKFSHNIELMNEFDVVLDQCRSESGSEGFYCQPTSTGLTNGYVASITLLNCFFNANTRNLFFNSPNPSFNLLILGGTMQDATGGAGVVGQAQLNNLYTVKIAGLYTEGALTPSTWYITSVGVLSIDGMVMNGGGPLTLLTNAFVSLKNIDSIGATLNAGSNAGPLTIENCNFPSSGNTLPTNTTLLGATTINGISATTLQATNIIGTMRSAIYASSVVANGTIYCYRFLDINGNVLISRLCGRFYAVAQDAANSANNSAWILDVMTAANGVTNTTLNQISSNVRGTALGASGTPFQLQADGAGGQVGLQFNAGPSIANINLNVTYMGTATP